MKRPFLLIFSLAILTTAFAQTNRPLAFTFTHKVGDDTLGINKTFFHIWNGKLLSITRAQFYLSEIKLGLPGGGNLPLEGRYLLVDASDPLARHDLGSWPVDAVSGVTMGLGVDPAHNHLDPTAWPSDHPLYPKNPSMHWGWAAGYTFMALEGKLDADNDGTPETIWQFHSIDDMLYKSIELSGNAASDGDTLRLHFDLDYVRLFNNIPLSANDLINHGSLAPNQQLMANADTASFFSMPAVLGTAQPRRNTWSVTLAPNPADAQTILRFAEPVNGPVELTLSNSLGQVLRRLQFDAVAETLVLSTAGLPEGLYTCTAYGPGHLMASQTLLLRH